MPSVRLPQLLTYPVTILLKPRAFTIQASKSQAGRLLLGVLPMLWLWLLAFGNTAVFAHPWNGDNPVKVSGYPRWLRTQKGDTLISLAYEHRVGFLAFKRLNQQYDPWLLPQSGRLRLPGRHLAPATKGESITINLAELRLYYLKGGADPTSSRIYPIAAGRDGWRTPTGSFRIITKVEDPIWRVPESILEKEKNQAKFVQPGPENPLGAYWLGLSADGYGIHSTNQPYGVGRWVSHGCIRMYPQYIKALFSRVGPGTPVEIVDVPLKVGIGANRLWLEVYPGWQKRNPNPIPVITQRARRLGWSGSLDVHRIHACLQQAQGRPQVIGSQLHAADTWHSFLEKPEQKKPLRWWQAAH